MSIQTILITAIIVEYVIIAIICWWVLSMGWKIYKLHKAAKRAEEEYFKRFG